MKEMMLEKIWKLRTVKDYPEAKNHIFVGKAVEITDSYVVLDCRTYHFGRTVNQPRDIRVGAVEFRVIPWGRIELVNLLDKDFDYKKPKIVKDENGTISLKSGSTICTLYRANDSRVF